MEKIFCDEVIIASYRGTREYDDMNDANSYFACCQEIAFHVTEGERIVLETENFYISLDVHGVTKSKKTCSIKELEQPGEWLDSHVHDNDDGEPPWLDYEATLFIGEHILEVQEKQNFFLVIFDDFELRIVPHAPGDKNFPCFVTDYMAHHRVLGLQRHLRKCACGNEGTVLLDFVSDYLICCTSCKKSTWAQMTVQDAIEEWNAGYLPVDVANIKIKW